MSHSISTRKSGEESNSQHHLGKIAFLAEWLIRKHDKFGWDRLDAEMRIMLRRGYQDTLCRFSIDEIKAGIDACETERPDKLPTEHHILNAILKAKTRKSALNHKPVFPAPIQERTDEERAAAMTIMRKAGFTKRHIAKSRQFPSVSSREALEAMSAEKRELEPSEYMTADEIKRECE